MNWPVRSPNLNPLEHVWDVLGGRVRAANPSAADLQELGQLLQQEWQAIPQATLRHFFDSMKHRCIACVNANGVDNGYQTLILGPLVTVTFHLGGMCLQRRVK